MHATQSVGGVTSRSVTVDRTASAPMLPARYHPTGRHFPLLFDNNRSLTPRVISLWQVSIVYNGETVWEELGQCGNGACSSWTAPCFLNVSILCLSLDVTAGTDHDFLCVPGQARDASRYRCSPTQSGMRSSCEPSSLRTGICYFDDDGACT